jgi:hypothetical protein
LHGSEQVFARGSAVVKVAPQAAHSFSNRCASSARHVTHTRFVPSADTYSESGLRVPHLKQGRPGLRQWGGRTVSFI